MFLYIDIIRVQSVCCPVDSAERSWSIEVHCRKSELILGLDLKKNDKCVSVCLPACLAVCLAVWLSVCPYNLQDQESEYHPSHQPQLPWVSLAIPGRPRPHVFPKPPQQTVETRQVLRLRDQLGP